MPLLRRLTSAPALAATLTILTVLAAGPLRPVDHALQAYWSKQLTPGMTDFLNHVPNAVAGQAVCLPVLMLVAVVLAWRHRTWHPVAVAAAAEAGFFLVVGGLKVVLGRTSPSVGDGQFFSGGVLEHGWYGIAYPSGHASEAILIYGTAAYLLTRYAPADSRVRGRLAVLVTAIVVNSLGVAYYLGYHWPTDLLAGALTGGLVLRVIVDVDLAWARHRLHVSLAGRERALTHPAERGGALPLPERDPDLPYPDPARALPDTSPARRAVLRPAALGQTRPPLTGPVRTSAPVHTNHRA